MNTNPTPAIQASMSGIHFFVGAGSSHRFSEQEDYDFPLGSCLFEDFQSHVRSADPHQLPNEQKSWAIKNFTKHESIDGFLGMADCLGHRALVELGRKLVDSEIIGCEQKVAKYFTDRSELLVVPWIESVLDFMIQDVHCYEVAYRRLKWVEDNNNPSYPTVNFATLNYDRLIEVSLKNYFASKYPDAMDQITKDFETPGNLVQHHHGSLGSLQERPFGDVKENPSPTLKFLFECPKKPQQWPIMNAMSNTRNHGVFLGFGFHQSIVTRFDFQGSKPKIYISDFGNKLEDEIETFLSMHELDAPIVTSGDNCCVELIEQLINEFSE
jgi:hypothetical protein